MDIKVLFSRGDGCYVVQKGDDFYLVNLETDDKPQVSKYADSFLKFGYFSPIDELDVKTLHNIKERLSD